MNVDFEAPPGYECPDLSPWKRMSLSWTSPRCCQRTQGSSPLLALVTDWMGRRRGQAARQKYKIDSLKNIPGVFLTTIFRLETSGLLELRNQRTRMRKKMLKMISKLLKGRVKVLDKPSQRNR